MLAALAVAGAVALGGACGGDGGDDEAASGRTTAGAGTTAGAAAVSCEEAFERQANAETAGEAIAMDGIVSTVLACENVEAWRAEAKRHAVVLGAFSPDEVLAMTCALDRPEAKFTVFCAEVGGTSPPAAATTEQADECEQAFAQAEEEVEVQAGGALDESTILACGTLAKWTATANRHPAVLGDFSAHDAARILCDFAGDNPKVKAFCAEVERG